MLDQQDNIFVSMLGCMLGTWRKRYCLGCQLLGVCDYAYLDIVQERIVGVTIFPSSCRIFFCLGLVTSAVITIGHLLWLEVRVIDDEESWIWRDNEVELHLSQRNSCIRTFWRTWCYSPVHRPYLQQVNDHNCKMSVWFDWQLVEVLNWSSLPTDFNIIEHMWEILQKGLVDKNVRTSTRS